MRKPAGQDLGDETKELAIREVDINSIKECWLKHSDDKMSAKFQLMIRRYSAPKRMTAASSLKNATMDAGAIWQMSVMTIITLPLIIDAV